MSPFLFILSLGALAVFIIAATHLSLLVRQSTDRGNNRADVNKKDNKRAKEEAQPLSADFAALIHTIVNEGSAYRAEEKREDSAKQFREWLTIVLLACTLFAIGWQVNEMVRVYEPIKTQADALLAAQRAWIGPFDTNLAGGLVGQGIMANVDYGNSGR